MRDASAAVVIYLVHHAPVPKRPGELVGSGTDRELDEAGLDRARQLAERIAQMLRLGIVRNVGNVLLTSPLRRALRTAELIAARNNLDVVVDSRFTAQRFGELEGLTPEEIRADARLAGHLWANIPPDQRLGHRAPGGETSAEVVSRVVSACDTLLATSATSPIVVTHGSVLDALISFRCGLPIAEYAGASRTYRAGVVEDSGRGIRLLLLPSI